MLHEWLLWLDAMTWDKAGRILVVLCAIYYLAGLAIELVRVYLDRRRTNRELVDLYRRNVAAQARIQREGKHGPMTIMADPRIPRGEGHIYQSGRLRGILRWDGRESEVISEDDPRSLGYRANIPVPRQR